MAPIHFYMMPESNPCQLVALVASLLDVPLKLHKINLAKGEHMSEEYLKINPAHKVPFIIDGDLKMGESRAIITYLVNKYGPKDSPLYPSDPIARARVDELLFFESTTLWPAGVQVYRPVLWQGKPIDQEKLEELKKVHQGVEDRLIAHGEGKNFLTGNNLTIGDIALANSAIGCSVFGFDLSKYKKLNAYVGRVKAAIPKYHEITDEPIANTKKIFQSKLPKN